MYINIYITICILLLTRLKNLSSNNSFLVVSTMDRCRFYLSIFFASFDNCNIFLFESINLVSLIFFVKLPPAFFK